ncbi:MAG: hypothetical protein ABIP51_03350 [Bacteroidia bacterium]
MSKTTIQNYKSLSKIIIYNNNKLEIASKTFFGQGSVFYNNIPISTKRFFGGLTSAFIAIENNKHIQYNITIGLRWLRLRFYTIVKRQGRVIYSDK